jgi:hypothetical protein
MGINDKRDERRRQAAADDAEDMIASANDFLDNNVIREVLALKCMFLMPSDGQWVNCKLTELGNHFPMCRSTKFVDALVEVMYERKYNYLKATYSYRNDLPADTFNLLDKARWLQPIFDQPHSPLFDVLMQSLGGNKKANIEHLEHCIVSKYLYPETSYHLPCVLIHGEGSVGKNLLVNVVLKAIFAGQTASTSKGNILEKFNSIIEGMAVVLIDEGADGFSTALKVTVGNKEITINRKFCPEFQSENLSWYLVSSNRDDGGIWLDRTTADRRFSVVLCNEGETLSYWLARHLGLWTAETADTEANRESILNVEVRQWQLTEGDAIFSDPIEIAKWLGNLIMKHGEQGIPKALHGDDYRALLDIQEPLHSRLITAVFTDPDFDHINRTTLHRAYDGLCRAHRTKHPLSDKKLYAAVEKFIKKLPIELTQTRQGGPVDNGTKPLPFRSQPEENKPRPRLWQKSTGNHSDTNNDLDYINWIGVWVGPELA